MKWRVGPIMGLTIFLAIAGLGAASSSPMTVTAPNGHADNTSVAQHSKNENPLAGAIWTWVADNHDAIEAAAAVSALIVAAAVALITANLYGATKNLVTSTDGLVAVANEQVAEMKKARIHAEKIFDLEEKQFLLAGRQCDLAEKQYGLQREQYLAEHRPRIKIRSISIDCTAGDVLQSDRIIRGSLVIVNIGASDAQIRKAVYRFFWGRELPMAPPLQGDQEKPLFGSMQLPHAMPGHESCLVSIESEGPIGADAHTIMLGGISLYVMGAVLFSDWNMKERWMGFCQKYTPPGRVGGEGRFAPIDNPDYEYED